MITMGIDIGSTTSKAALLKDGKEILATDISRIGTGTRGPKQVFDSVLAKAGIERGDISRIIATGYGRMTFSLAERELSEVSCHGKGANFLVPGVKTVIDIGGQDSKAIQLDGNGNLLNFIMNDKCAAGTGRFLEAMARVLDIQIEEMGELSAKATRPSSISSTCTVFAESEVISRLSNEESVEDILAGIHVSIAKRVASLAMRMGVNDPVVMTGGVAQNSGVVKAMENILGKKIIVPRDCQYAGAIGAAIYAFNDLMKKK